MATPFVDDFSIITDALNVSVDGIILVQVPGGGGSSEMTGALETDGGVIGTETGWNIGGVQTGA